MYDLRLPFSAVCRASGRCAEPRGFSLIVAVVMCTATMMEKTSAANPVATYNTSLGTFQVELLNNVAPQTVSNFLSYVDSGAYNNTFIHRTTTVAYDGLAVVQGGGYSTNGAPFNGAHQPTHIDTLRQTLLPNEYSAQVPNAIGTLAMALTGGNNGPNGSSGTSEWFFNVGDNTQILSPAAAQNGVGYAVFGRVLGDGMQVVNAIQGLQRLEDVLGLTPAESGQLGIFGPIPVRDVTVDTTSLDVNNLVTINSITVPRVPGDVNLDGFVNTLDIVLAVKHWQENGSFVLGDANKDQRVNSLDIAFMAQHWGQTLGSIGSGNASGVFDTAGGPVNAIALVPEPASFMLAYIGLSIAALRSWYRARRIR